MGSADSQLLIWERGSTCSHLNHRISFAPSQVFWTKGTEDACVPLLHPVAHPFHQSFAIAHTPMGMDFSPSLFPLLSPGFQPLLKGCLSSLLIKCTSKTVADLQVRSDLVESIAAKLMLAIM